MRSGVTRRGNAVTYHGNDATLAFVRMSASYCMSQEEADLKVERASLEMRPYFVKELTKFGYTFDAEKIAALNAKSEKEELEQRAAHLKKLKDGFREKPVETKTTSSKCFFCDSRITKGSPYHDGGKGERAHVTCVEAT